MQFENNSQLTNDHLTRVVEKNENQTIKIANSLS